MKGERERPKKIELCVLNEHERKEENDTDNGEQTKKNVCKWKKCMCVFEILMLCVLYI